MFLLGKPLKPNVMLHSSLLDPLVCCGKKEVLRISPQITPQPLVARSKTLLSFNVTDHFEKCTQLLEYQNFVLLRAIWGQRFKTFYRSHLQPFVMLYWHSVL